MTKPILYHIYPSFYSQVARLALVEKNVAWTSAVTVAGPPFYDNYAPEYVRMNPNAVVPTLRHGDMIVYEATRIARYVDVTFPGPRLTPEDTTAKSEMDRWVDRLDELPIRILSYGSLQGRAGKLALNMNAKRIAKLERLRDEHPDLRAVYEAKIEDMRDFSQRAVTPGEVNAARDRAMVFLDELETNFKGREFVVGHGYSLADVIWTVTVGRMIMLKLEPLSIRPHVAAWYGRMKARPSFREADIWETFRPASMLRSVGERLFGRKV